MVNDLNSFYSFIKLCYKKLSIDSIRKGIVYHLFDLFTFFFLRRERKPSNKT